MQLRLFKVKTLLNNAFNLSGRSWEEPVSAGPEAPEDDV